VIRHMTSSADLEMLISAIVNPEQLDFGSGAEVLLLKAQASASAISGMKLEERGKLIAATPWVYAAAVIIQGVVMTLSPFSCSPAPDPSSLNFDGARQSHGEWRPVWLLGSPVRTTSFRILPTGAVIPPTS